MIASELHPGTQIWVKPKNKSEYELAQNDNEKELQVTIIKNEPFSPFVGLVFKVDNSKKVIFVHQTATILA